MTYLPLKERLERLERTRDVPGPSGSSEVVDLVPPDHLPDLKTISAIKSLARRGVRLALAKALVEDLHPPATAHAVNRRVPHVEARDAFATEMVGSGVRVQFTQFTGAHMDDPPHPGGFVWSEIVDPTGCPSRTRRKCWASVGSRSRRSSTSGPGCRLVALRIEKAFGVSMDTLMRMQTTYHIAEMRSREKTVKVGRRFFAE